MSARLLALACCLAPLVAGAAPGGRYDCLIEPRQTVEVRADVDGVIDSIRVRRGEAVKRGQLIATLESGTERAALAVARWRAEMTGDLKSAEAHVDLARKKWQRAAQLEGKNFVSKDARDEAEAQYRLATDQLQAARENVRLAKLDEKRAAQVVAQREIRSPIDGVVVEVKLHPGELLSSNQKDPIMKLAELDPLNVELILRTSQYGKIKVGERAKVLPETGGAYDAEVEVVDQVVDAASGTFGVRLKLPNPGRRVPAGVKCQVQF